MKTLIVIANSEWAQFVELEKNAFQLIEEREHPQSKDKVEHLVSDRPGRAFSHVSPVRHSLNEGQDVLGAEREKFAREVVGWCKERHRTCPFEQLWIVAGPKFLGELRPLFQSIHHPPYSTREIHKELSLHESLHEKMGKIQRWVYEDAQIKWKQIA